MKTRLFLFIGFIFPLFTFSQTNPAKNAKTIIGRLYFENKFDSLFVVLPEFIEMTEIGSPEWEEMERWLPHAYFYKAMDSESKDEGELWASLSDSTWGATEKRRGLVINEKFARIEVWQYMEQWQRIIDKVETDKPLQEKDHFIEAYFGARLKNLDTLDFIDDINSSVIRYSTQKDPYLYEYYELVGDYDAAIAGYEKKLAERPDSRWPNSEIFWARRYAQLLMGLERWEEGLEKINIAIESNKGYQSPFFQYDLFDIRAEIYRNLGRYEEATADSTFYMNHKKRVKSRKGTLVQ